MHAFKKTMIIFKESLSTRPGKYDIRTAGYIKVLSFQIQNGIPTLWFLIDDSEDERIVSIRTFQLVFTGQSFPRFPDEEFVFVGTTQTPDGLVWHLFEIVRTKENE